MRAAYHFIATGETLDGSWYRELDEPASNPNVQEHRDQQCTISVTLDEGESSSTATEDNVDENNDDITEDDVESIIESYKKKLQ